MTPRPYAEPASFLPARPAWQLDANCLGCDPDLFFPGREVSNAKVEAAREVCQGCTVSAECLEYALENHEQFGIWSGTTERQRHRLQKQRRRAGIDHGTRRGYQRCTAGPDGGKCEACTTANNRYLARWRAS